MCIEELYVRHFRLLYLFGDGLISGHVHINIEDNHTLLLNLKTNVSYEKSPVDQNKKISRVLGATGTKRPRI